MKRRKFKVVFAVEVDIEVNDDVIEDALSKDFKSSYYDFADAAAVAAHLAYNFVANRASSLSVLDGFAHHDPSKVKVAGESWDQVDVEEIK